MITLKTIQIQQEKQSVPFDCKLRDIQFNGIGFFEFTRKETIGSHVKLETKSHQKWDFFKRVKSEQLYFH